MNKIKVDNLALLATNAAHSPWGIAFNESQRLAIEADATFYENKPDGGTKGLIAARTIAMLSYRTYEIYEESQKDDNQVYDCFKASSYQNYQGQKLANRFNAYSYWILSKAMDSQNIARNRKSLVDSLIQIKSNTIVIGVSSDILFPTTEQKFIAAHIPNAEYIEIDSIFGHDGFLVELEELNRVLKPFT